VISLNLSSKPGSSLSGNDVLILLDVIHRSLACDSEEEFKGLFPRIQELLSCDHAIAALGYLDGSNKVVIADGINISFPDEWCVEYRSNDYVRWDPIVKENFTKYRLQWWSEAKKKIHCNDVQKKIASLCMDFDMKEGFTMGSKPSSPGKNGSMFCFSGRLMKNDDRSEAILESITPHLHLAFSRVFGKKQSKPGKVALSLREKEVLNWMKRGKSSWEMSVILGISERTVNFHVHNIMRKLNATNRPSIIAVAAGMGLLNLGL
jgi:DNA-binding CsgD family transcriptional regulator